MFIFLGFIFFLEQFRKRPKRRSFEHYFRFLGDHPDLLFKLLKLVASHTGKLVNLSDFGVKLGLDRLTIKKYLVILEQMFLLEQLPAWHSSEYNRLVKAPKLQLVDTGMMCAMRGFGQAHLQAKTED